MVYENLDRSDCKEVLGSPEGNISCEYIEFGANIGMLWLPLRNDIFMRGDNSHFAFDSVTVRLLVFAREGAP